MNVERRDMKCDVSTCKNEADYAWINIEVEEHKYSCKICGQYEGYEPKCVKCVEECNEFNNIGLWCKACCDKYPNICNQDGKMRRIREEDMPEQVLEAQIEKHKEEKHG